MHVVALDTGSYGLIALSVPTAHFGLEERTLAQYAQNWGDLQPLLHRLLTFETAGVYLPSERGHGVDSFNLKTTATKTHGGFILNTS
ncbi:hypothetical protein A0H81_03438 [Grifola frondosa]|uniref:Uncharacterized protein n=1 Tax=Grifola frondosa TaxID=5627 RepID=A0A1C7MHU4_GRIFR|nr:hypothetical protein A0H81_03438 [Grifola frondosa]